MSLTYKFLFENLTDIYYKVGLFYTVVKTMREQRFCQDCKQKNDCQEAYQQLGKAKGPSVVPKVVFAFLLPLIVFIVSLAASEKILSKTVNTKQMLTVFSLLTATAVTFACILTIKAINKKFSKTNKSRII